MRPILFDRNDEVPPYIYKDEDDCVIDRKEVYYDADTIKQTLQEDSFGEILVGDETENMDPIDLVVNILKSSGILNKNDIWQPNLDPVKEERYIDIRLIRRYTDDPFQQKPTCIIKQQIRKFDAKIQKGIASKGIYHVQIDTTQKAQHNRGANRSVYRVYFEMCWKNVREQVLKIPT